MMDLLMTVLIAPSAILTTAGVLSLLLKRASSSVRHAVWATGILVASLLPAVFTLFPTWEIPLIGSSGVWIVPQVSEPPFDGAQVQGFVLNLGQPVVPTADFIPAAPRISEVLILIWLAGFITVVVRFLLGIRAVRQLMRHSVPTARDWCAAVPISPSVDVRVANATFPPMTWGIVRSVILLPAEAAAWDAERRHAVLAHELAHIARRDGAIQVLIQLTSAVYWFNPLLWFAVRCLRIEREQACDDHVLRLGLRPHIYAKHLLEVARFVRPKAVALPTVTMAHPSQLEARLRSIMDMKKSRLALSGLTTGSIYLTAVLATMVAGTVRLHAVTMPMLSAVLPPPEISRESESAIGSQEPITVPQPAPAEIKPVYQKWLTEDVAYIISDGERARFNSLNSDEERDQFINQFWLRRDPTPGTLKNEFEEEHYERIAYANERFSAGIPGWKTDRGRMLIVHGRPDEKEIHAVTSPGTAPYERWTYRYLEPIGNNVRLEFSDRQLNGEYPLSAAEPLRTVLLTVRPAAAAAWAGFWRLNKDQSQFLSDPRSPTMADAIETLTLRFDGNINGITVTVDVHAKPPDGSGSYSQMTNVFALKTGAPVEFNQLFPFMPVALSGTLTLNFVNDTTFQIVISDAQSGTKDVVTFTVSGDGRTLFESYSPPDGFRGVFDKVR